MPSLFGGKPDTEEGMNMESAKAMLDALVRRVGCPWGILLAAGLLWGAVPTARAYYATNVLGYNWYCTVSTNGEATIQNPNGSAYCAVRPAPNGLLTLPSSLDGYPVTGIGSGAFLNCTNLTGIVIPTGLRTITFYGYSPVGGCPKFENVCVHDIAAWCDMSFNKLDGAFGVFGCLWCLQTRNASPDDEPWSEAGHLVIPEGVERVASNAFWGCKSLRSVTFPRSLKRIEKAAFRDCPNLTNLVFRSESLEIGPCAFWGCTNLTQELVIPEGVTHIGGNAFCGCSNLVKVSIAATVTNIVSGYATSDKRNGAFAGCPSIIEVTLPPCAKASAIFPSYTNIVKAAVSPGAASVGDAMFSGCVALEEVAIPDTLEVVGSGAFRACAALEEVVLPPGVETIGSMAFYGCTNLARIDLPAGLKSIGRDAFEGCSRLTEIVVPDGVTDIGGEAFGGCTGVTNMVLPLSITNIHMKYTYGEGFGAFMSCSSIVEATVPPYAPMRDLFPAAYTNIAKATVVDGAINICTSMFNNCKQLRKVVLPATLEAVEYSGFSDCTALESIDLPQGLKSIGGYAFARCPNLARITIPDSVETIGACAFDQCSLLDGVVLPSGLTRIEDSVFWGCSSLGEIDIPEGVTEIDRSPFQGCTNLARISIPRSVTSMTNLGCGNVKDVSMPSRWTCTTLFGNGRTSIVHAVVLEGETNMCASMFSGCSGLREVSIPATVEALGNSAFWYCTGLEEVELPAGVKSIGNYAFGWCTNLVRAGIPSGMNEIGSSAFSSCSRLVDVVFSGNAPACGTGIYSSTPGGLTSWVRQGSTGWDGNAESTALPDTWQGRPIRRWGTAEYEAAGEAVPDTRTETGGVPLVWLDERDLARDGDYEAAAASDAANGRPVWECYVAGLDPEDPEAEFKVRLWFEDGAVHLGWTPDWSDAEDGSGRTYRLMGKKSMDTEWEDVLEPADLSAEGWRFFRVGVSLPPEQGE